jgi:hypothetical protein
MTLFFTPSRTFSRPAASSGRERTAFRGASIRAPGCTANQVDIALRARGRRARIVRARAVRHWASLDASLGPFQSQYK